MKEIKKSILTVLSLVFIFGFWSCNNDEDVDYTPKVYLQPSDLTITIDNATDTSFDLSFTAVEDGVVYYAIQESNSTALDAEAIIRENSSSLVVDATDLLAGVVNSTVITEGIYGGYTYLLYSVMTSSDGVASSVVVTEVTTLDTADPVFLGDSSDPAHLSPDANPFGAVTFNFTEPVYYQGGTITFEAYYSGRVITVDDADVISSSGTTIVVDTHGTFAHDDVIVVTWPADTFQDISGKSVAELTWFSHYFGTRLFTPAESAYLMQGTYEYTTEWYGGLESFYLGLLADYPDYFIPDSGTFELVLDPTDETGTTLLGVNVFNGLIGLGLNEPEFMPIKFGDGGSLEIVYTPSVITGGGQSASWGPWYGSYPGFYYVNEGEIHQWLTLAVDSSGSELDDIDYIYERIGTFEKSSSDLSDLKKRNALRKDNILKGGVRVLPSKIDLLYE